MLSYYLILRILFNDKPIIKKIARVTFFAIGIEDLHSCWNIFETNNLKAFLLVNIVPRCLFRQSMVEHICKGSQNISFNSIYQKSKNSATNYGSCPTKIFEFILSKFLAWGTNLVIVSLEIIDFLMYLYEEGWPDQLHKFIITVIDGKATMIFGKNIEVKFPRRLVLLNKLLKEEDC